MPIRKHKHRYGPKGGLSVSGKFFGKYALNLLVWLDQGVNAIFFGDPDDTLSSRIGRVRAKHGGRVPRYRLISCLIDMFLDSIDDAHTLRSIEEFEGGDALIDRIELSDWMKPMVLVDTELQPDRVVFTFVDPDRTVSESVSIPTTQMSSAMFMVQVRRATRRLMKPEMPGEKNGPR